MCIDIKTCKFRIDKMWRKLTCCKLSCISQYHSIIFDHILYISSCICKDLWSEHHMIDNIYLSIRKEHKIEKGWTLYISFYFVCYVIVFLIGLDHLLDYEWWIVQFHQLRNVYYLVVTELEYHVLLHKVSELNVIQIQTYCYVEKEPSCHCSSVWVDSDHLLHLRPWIYRHKNGPWVFHILKWYTLHQ